MCRDFPPNDKEMTSSPVGDKGKKKLPFSEMFRNKYPNKETPFSGHKDLKVPERV